MKKALQVRTGLLGAALLLAACDSGTASPTPVASNPGTSPAASTLTATPAPLTKVVIAMGYIPNVQFAPFYLAEDRGYYAAEGLQVDFKYGQVNDLLKVVGEGTIDYANVSGDEMVPAVAQGIPVRYIMTSYYRYPIAAVALGDGPALKAPADLKGHNIGVPGPYGSTYIGLKALLKAGNLQESDVDLKNIGFTQVSALAQKQVDLAMTYSMNEPVQLQNQGKTVQVLQVSDYADLAAVGLATSEQKLKTHAAEARGFIRATLKGTMDVLKDPDAAFASSLKRMPEMAAADQPVQRAVLTATLPFWTPPAGRIPGTSDEKTWQNTEQFLREIGISSKPVAPKDLYTNDLVNPSTQ